MNRNIYVQIDIYMPRFMLFLTKSSKNSLERVFRVGNIILVGIWGLGCMAFQLLAAG